MGPKFWANVPASGLKLVFFLSPFPQLWFISFPLNCIGWLGQCIATSRARTEEKNFRNPKLGPNLGCIYFLKFAWLVFLGIAQDCSFGKFSHPVELKPPKRFWFKLGPNRFYSIFVLFCYFMSPCYSRNLEFFSILVSFGIHTLFYFLLKFFSFMLLTFVISLIKEFNIHDSDPLEL